MSESSNSVNEAELGRSKNSTSPSEHLYHLLTIGWHPESPLIKKYVAANGLHSVLRDWVDKVDSGSKAR